MMVIRSLLFATLAVLSAAATQAQTATIVGGRTTYVVAQGDTLTAVAARHGVTTASLAALNQLSESQPLPIGRTLTIDNPHIAMIDASVAITINIAQRMLFFASGGAVTGYPIAVGRRSWPTPVGAFTVVGKETNPTWDVPISIQREMAAEGKQVITKVAPSPDNPLGTRWIALSLPGLGIHGTNAPASIYRYASHGCIRMHPEHILELFERVTVGMAGVLTYQPIVFAVIDGRMWLEVHPDPYGRVADAMAQVRALASSQDAMEMTDWGAVEAAVRRRAGRAEDVTRAAAGDPRGE